MIRQLRQAISAMPSRSSSATASCTDIAKSRTVRLNLAFGLTAFGAKLQHVRNVGRRTKP